MRYLNVYTIFFLVVLLSGCSGNADKNSNDPVDKRVKLLLSQMTMEEKVSLLGGYDGMTSNGIERLGIPRLNMANGPHGVGGVEGATFFSSSVLMGASWNSGLVEEIGKAIGAEARVADKNIMLGPCVNIHHLPIGGRNFESYSEAPYLASLIGVAWINGVQGEERKLLNLRVLD